MAIDTFTKRPVDRRFLLKTVGVGVLGAAAIPVLAACTGSGAGGGGATTSKTVTFGSGSSDDVPKAAYKAVTDAFTKKSGDQGHHQHRRPQRLPEQHQHLPAGQPGRRLHLVRRLPHAVLRRARACSRRSTTSGRRSAATSPRPSKKASTGADGKKYFVPNYNYPWGVLLPQERLAGQGLQVPTTFDELEDPAPPR